MPFDANLVLIDGTVDITAATAASYVAATSTTRETTNTGAVVVDLKETGFKGLAAVLVIPVLVSSTDYLTAIIQVSDEEDFGNATYHLHEVAKFDIHAETTGVILASECTAGAIVVKRFVTDKRYVRAKLIPVKGTGVAGNFGKVQVLISPYPFNLL